MRILLLCSADLNGCINLNLLLPRLCGKHEVRVMLSDYELREERGHDRADEKLWYEKDFLRKKFFPGLDALEKNDAQWRSFAGLERRFNIPVVPIDSREPGADLLRAAQSFRAELILCCRFDYILHRDVFSLPRLGTYNLHSGLLPQCAGPDATFWAMRKGWEYSGCTLHLVTEQIDRGDIVAQARFRLDYSRSVLWNRTQAYLAGCKKILWLTRRLGQGGMPVCVRQAPDAYRYYAFPKEAEFRALYSAGLRMVSDRDYVQLLQHFLPEGVAMPAYRRGSLFDERTVNV